MGVDSLESTMGYQVKGAQQQYATELLVYHVNEAAEPTIQPVPLDASSRARLTRWLYNQAVIRARSERKTQFREGYRRRKVNRVLPCAQGLWTQYNPEPISYCLTRPRV